MPRKVKIWHLEIRHPTGEQQEQFLGGQQKKVVRPKEHLNQTGANSWRILGQRTPVEKTDPINCLSCGELH